ncbi:hypothetical protein MSG28_015267 [Choristoneura fumiferana]|uniref:Uncharacterized protein n=1 Tax=Choristoneura fumiferana TaxID=7141 RepID=A0ACC0K9Q6_CHOFU|nr:hypothetical protein MSG28_015267 [Choristoneura fumiferana]
MLPTVEESRGYDFEDPENAKKWRGLFVNSLRKVLEQVHPSLSAEESALEYVESLCLRLLAMLCANPSPLCVQDVEERVARTFPTPIDKWALHDAREAAAARRRRLLLPHDRLHHMLQKEVLMYKIDTSVSVFMTAILEYVSADLFKLAGNFVKKISQKSGYETITCNDIKTAMCADKPPCTRTAPPRLERLVFFIWFCMASLDRLARSASGPLGDSPLLATTISCQRSGVSPNAASTRGPPVDNEWMPKVEAVLVGSRVLLDMFYQESLVSLRSSEARGRRGSLSYAELVRELLTDEKHFLRDLHLIIRVFKDELEKILDQDTRFYAKLVKELLTGLIPSALQDELFCERCSPPIATSTCIYLQLSRCVTLSQESNARNIEPLLQTISLIFGNIVDIYELTVTLLGNLEDAIEMSQDSPTPYIGSCFEGKSGNIDKNVKYNLEVISPKRHAPHPTHIAAYEKAYSVVPMRVRHTVSTFGVHSLKGVNEWTSRAQRVELAEVEEFRAYVRYANIVTTKESRDALQNIVSEPAFSERLDTAGHGFRLAVKYYLPKLLLAPVAHVFLYHSYVLALLQVAPATDDRESFKQVECNLHPIKKLLMKALGNGPKIDLALRMAARARRQLAIEKCNELARLVDNWDNRDTGQCCNEFIRVLGSASYQPPSASRSMCLTCVHEVLLLVVQNLRAQQY